MLLVCIKAGFAAYFHFDITNIYSPISKNNLFALHGVPLRSVKKEGCEYLMLAFLFADITSNLWRSKVLVFYNTLESQNCWGKESFV
ncbi:hypothetical protein HBI20_218320 [Parastagonospora nodorum]|nr:hypothetical protein HBI20_218320 [Parastagonospora nodorum]